MNPPIENWSSPGKLGNPAKNEREPSAEWKGSSIPERSIGNRLDGAIEGEDIEHDPSHDSPGHNDCVDAHRAKRTKLVEDKNHEHHGPELLQDSETE